ncbi:Integrin alpha-8 [Anthophora quadrimaculata]
MFVTGIFLLLVETASGYNVDIDFPIIYSRGDTLKSSNAYFGYTVLLHREVPDGTSWLFVGAPKENFTWSESTVSGSKGRPNYVETGVVYRCAIEGGECKKIIPYGTKGTYIHQIKTNVSIQTEHGWFGSTMSVHEKGLLMVCAPRTTLTILDPFSVVDFNTMQGICYFGYVTWNTLIMDKNFSHHDFKSTFWYNPLYGFSSHIPSVKKSNVKEYMLPIVGEPKRENYGAVDIKLASGRITVELPLSDDTTQFGYSVDSGYFFKRDQLLYVSGAPGWRYVGTVGIINPYSNVSVIGQLHGTDIGEYFGASLAVGDLNNDGLDDLLVGAPYWGEDNGKVYVFFGTSKGQFEVAAILKGNSKGGYFGYAIACGDLDADGFDDIIVGAPWEEDGVIYIYNGDSDLKNTNLQISQRIEASKLRQLNVSRKIQTFGFSLSKPVDIDGNGYQDIAVGAYKSEHAVILRSKPVVKTKLDIQAIPHILQRNAKLFLLQICPKFIGYNVESVQGFKITLTIDERYQRTNETVLELKSFDTGKCLFAVVNISMHIRDFIEPISIFAKHDFIYDNASSNFCKFCPVEKRDNKLHIAQTLVPFKIDCGEDKICNSYISAIAKFHNVRDNDIWIIGSTDISLEINLKNSGEPAYLTTLEFTFPEGVTLRSILTSCQEDTSKEALLVICDIGNPIWNEEEKSIKLDLDMRHLINGSLYDHKLYFNVAIKTNSINRGTTYINKTLNLMSEVSATLHGKANEEAYYFTALDEGISNVSFQHTYQVYKLGPSPLESARLVVKVPLATKDSKILVHVHQFQMYISGEPSECSSENILLDTQLDKVQGEPSSNESMTLFSNMIEKHGEHMIGKRNLEKSILWFDDWKNNKAPQSLNESWSDHVIYMNCSMSDVNCATITCDLSALKTLQDVGKMQIKLFLNIDNMKNNFRNDKTILKFSTEASVEIIEPAVRIHIHESRSTMKVATMFYNSPKIEELQLWIILISVLMGLLLLLIFGAILSKFGFFKRKSKEDFTVAKVSTVK